MDYNEALEYIHSAPKLTKPLGNANLEKVLKKIGSPEKKLKFIHIAGTNGKGSTSAMTEAVLRSAGYCTGLFISPYIERFNERIRVSGIDIADSELAEITTEVRRVMNDMNIELYEFALIFVIAMLYFSRRKCDIVVLEAGLGGRLDATNCIESSLVSAITSIGFDHMQYLGNTLPEIAREKSGIIKRRGTIILYNGAEKEIFEVVSSEALRCDAKLISCRKPVVENNKLVFNNSKYSLSLAGEYQYANAALSLEIVEVLINAGYDIQQCHIKEGLMSVVWPGRFEWLSNRILLDGCHNCEGVQKFVESAKLIKKPITVVTGVMSDKDYSSVARELSKLTSDIIVTTPSVLRALEASEYKKVFSEFGINAIAIDNPFAAVNTALEKGGICAVCGSLYLIGEVRKKFKTKTTH